MSDTDDEEYVVEAIRDWRFNYRTKQKEYLIKWKGYDESVNSWVPENDCACPLLVQDFTENLDEIQTRYFFSADPTKLTGFKRHASYLKCLGADGPHEDDDKGKFYCLVLFDDCDFAEEVDLHEFFKYKPKEAFEFLEQRLLLESDDADKSQED